MQTQRLLDNHLKCLLPYARRPLASCQLFENGGNYDKPEVEWYQGQIDEINAMITTCKDQRTEKVAELVEEMNKLQQEP